MLKKICIVILVSLYSCKQIKSEEKLKDRDSIMSEYIKMGKARWIYNYWENNGTAGDVPILSKLWKQTSKTAHQDSINEYWKTQVINDSLIKIFKADFIKSPPLKNKTVKILWNNRINGELINKEYFTTMSEPERAAIGYITKLRHTSENTDDKYTIENALN